VPAAAAAPVAVAKAPPAAAATPVPQAKSAPAPATAPLPAANAAPATPAAPAGGAATAVSVSSPAAAAAPAGERVVSFAELPPDVQRSLPKVQISGGVHSANPAQRMLIVGGQVRTEGAELAPGLRLEQIRPHTAVLKFGAWRYSVSY